MKKNSEFGFGSCIGTILAAMIVFIGLFLFFSIPEREDEEHASAALLTVIPAPTLTPTVHATTAPMTMDIRYVSDDGLSIGALVEIYNTNNQGLSVRPNPGTGGTLNFVAGEGERFYIAEGPDAKNDYVWWKLQSPTNENRNGWAAAEFLRLVEAAPEEEGDYVN